MMRSQHPGHDDLSSQTDAEVYVALKAGYTAALGVLYDRHAGLVYGLALKILGIPQEAEDLVQDVFLTLNRTNSYQPDRGSLRTFLAILTRSRALDRMRSRSTAVEFVRRWHPSGTAEDAGNSPLEHATQQEQLQEIRAALAQLSDSQQQILKMAYYDGLTQSEIATQLEIPLGTVKARARRGLLKLRQTLTHYMR